MTCDYLAAFQVQQPSVYDQFQIAHILANAQQRRARSDYFQALQQGEISAAQRASIISWFETITVRKNLSRNIIIRATMLLDNFMSTMPSLHRHPLFISARLNFSTLAAAVSYDVASKVETQHGISKSIVLSFKLSAAQFLDAELLFLDIIKYDAYFATPLQVLEVLSFSINESSLSNSRPESPIQAIQEDKKLAFLLAKAAEMVHVLLKNDKFIGLSALEMALFALCAAAQYRKERLNATLRRISTENGIAFELIQQGAKYLLECALREEICDDV